MKKPIVAALIGSLIALVVYISVISAALVRDLNASEMDRNATIAMGEPSDSYQSPRDLAKPELTLAQSQLAHKKRSLHVISRKNKSRFRVEPVTLIL